MAHPQQVNYCKSVKRLFPELFSNRMVADIGSLDINGNNQYLFGGCLYLGIDVAPGRNVDICCCGSELALPDETFDTVISTECFEHDLHYEKTLSNIIRMLKPGGLFIFTCATTGRPEHGTRRSEPGNAPLLNDLGVWADYYKNLDEADVRKAIDIDKIFGSFEFAVEFESCDLYFWGIKKGTPLLRDDYSFCITNEDKQPIIKSKEENVEKDRIITALLDLLDQSRKRC